MRGQLGTRNADEQVEVEVVDLDTTLHGYHVAWNYGTRYWLPLLGPLPWAVWQTLLSFCFGDRDTCWPSISLIADIAARGERSLITGRWRGKGDTRQRQPGALEILQEAGLLAIETQHSGPQTRYRFHVLKEPPILAPDQLAKRRRASRRATRSYWPAAAWTSRLIHNSSTPCAAVLSRTPPLMSTTAPLLARTARINTKKKE